MTPRSRLRRSLSLAIPPLLAAALALALVPAAAGSSAAGATAGSDASAAAPRAVTGVPAVRHVWVVNLENKGYDETFGATSPAPFLSKTLPAQGALLRQYFGIGHVSLPNYIAQQSGQAPNPTTQSDCQNYSDVAPGIPTSGGQVIGNGCVYPPAVQTLAGQLSAVGVPWKGYLQDMGNDAGREPRACGNPGPAGPTPVRDPTQRATATDRYAARHNPFVYFHSLLDTGLCAANVHRFDELAGDLASSATTPAYSLITPDLCNDGHDDPCVGSNADGGTAGGLVAADAFLRRTVPLITGSPAFRDGGVLVVTFDESEGTSGASAAACCGEQPGPNTPMPGIGGPGGGRVGAVVLSPFVRPGTVSDVPYNHYSLLRSLEDLLGVTTGGADGRGHLGYAGQDGLVPFGADVFTSPAQPAGGTTGGAGGAGGGGGQPAAAVPATLSLTASRRSLTAGDALALAGTMRDSAGAPLAGRVVALGCPGVGASAVTDGAGAYRAVLRPRRSGICVASAAGLRAGPRPVAVAWRSQLSARSRLVQGRISPATPRVRVVVRGAGRLLAIVRTDGSGRWHVRLGALAPGRHRLSVAVTPSRGLHTTTAVRSVRVA